MEEETGIEDKCLSNLPPDLLILIGSYLLPKDCARLASTCKSYQLIFLGNEDCEPPPDAPLSESPRLLFSEDKLYHPIYRIGCRLDNIEPMGIKRIHDSNFGWFLVTLGTVLFFVNPTTEARVELPPFPEDKVYTFNVHFTCTPTSPKCHIIRIAKSPLPGMLRVYTLSRNQKSWTIYDRNARNNFSVSACNPILYNGAHFCLGVKGNFMKFNPVEETCSYSECDSDIKEKFESSYASSYLVDNDEELLAVFVARNGTWVGVYRLNVIDMVFERIYNLGNRVLYVSSLRSFSETATLGGTGNKIFLPVFQGDDSLFYSLDTNKFHTYTGYSAQDLYGTKAYVNPHWVKPHWVKPMFGDTCKDDFDW